MLFFGERPNAEHALHQGARRHAHRAHSQGGQHGQRKRDKQDCKQPPLPVLLFAPIRAASLLFSYFENHKFPPSVNLRPMRNVNGSDGKPKASL